MLFDGGDEGVVTAIPVVGLGVGTDIQELEEEWIIRKVCAWRGSTLSFSPENGLERLMRSREQRNHGENAISGANGLEPHPES
jgi:hypothetical protein